MKGGLTMKVKLVAIVLCITVLSIPLGCANVMEEHKGAAVGSGVGGAVGGVMGAIIGHGTGAVVVGTLAGALLGGAIGHFGYDQERSREQTVKNYSYKESQGTVLTIESLKAMPATVRPGETVDLKMTYALLHDAPDTKITVTEIREITYKGGLVGRPEVKVEQTDGTYTTTVPLRLPSSAEKGTYRVKAMVESQYAKDAREITFTVR
jgi:outer membrane lipoprotein SlyB